MPTITATYEDGVLKPAQPLDLPDRAQVRITIELVADDVQKAERLAAVESLARLAKVHAETHLTRDELHERGVQRD
jgi:predicted DNA-binding antitoxin AbrB/MazE fold protein